MKHKWFELNDYLLMHPFFYGFAECGRKENYVQSVHWLYCSCLVTMDRFTIYSSSAGHRLHSLLKSIKCLFQVQLFKQCEVFKDYENHVEKYFYWEFFFLNWNTEHKVYLCVIPIHYSFLSFIRFWTTNIRVSIRTTVI